MGTTTVQLAMIYIRFYLPNATVEHVNISKDINGSSDFHQHACLFHFS